VALPAEPPPEADYGLGEAASAAMTAEAEPPPAREPGRDQGITIAPFKPAAAEYQESDFDVEIEMRAAFAHDQNDHAEAPFIPPQAEAPSVRMPRVEDFPSVAQRQIEAHHHGRPPQQEEDRGPLSLLRRLANVGLGRREDDSARTPPPVRKPKAVQPPPQRPAPQRVAAPPPPPSDYAKRPPAPRAPAPDSMYRPRQAELDPHGRPLPREQRSAEDELEIPAFLRRQAN
jgi:cell division protein FtsZ